MVIAAEHAEGEGVAAGEDVEEGLLFDRVAGERADVAVGDEERAVVVEAHAADAVAAGLDEAAVPAGEALDVAVVVSLDQGSAAAGMLNWCSISFSERSRCLVSACSRIVKGIWHSQEARVQLRAVH